MSVGCIDDYLHGIRVFEDDPMVTALLYYYKLKNQEFSNCAPRYTPRIYHKFAPGTDRISCEISSPRLTSAKKKKKGTHKQKKIAIPWMLHTINDVLYRYIT